MDADNAYDLRVTVAPDAAGPVRVLHPCRCDAPDPEAARIEPIEVPIAEVLAGGSRLVICPECDYRVLAVVEARDGEHGPP